MGVMKSTAKHRLPSKDCYSTATSTVNSESWLMREDNHDDQFDLTYRGHVSMKGKAEPMQTWFLTRKTN